MFLEMMMKKYLSLFLPALFAFSLGSLAQAQDAEKWPVKAVHLIVPFASGGSTDLIARRVANELSKKIGQPVIVENKAGASGVIGSSFVAKQPADGYTLLMGSVSTHAMAPSVFAKLPYDIIKDFTPITLVGTIPDLIVVHPNLPAKNLTEFIALAKSKPGKMTFATAGNGTSSHLGSAYFAAEAGIDLNQVPYKGSGPALLDVLGGHVDMMLDVIMTSIEPLKAGKLRALAVTSLNRSPLLPEVPTVHELGIKNFEAIIWFGILAPGNMSVGLQNKIADAFDATIHSSEINSYLQKQGVEPGGTGALAFAARIKADTEKWAGVVKLAGIRPE
jgi:tripartite-type tricarboxylate transporter receptor subunit TctC